MRRLMAAALVMAVASSVWAAPAGLQSSTLGQGPTLVMLHNLGGTRTGWMPTARKLLPNYRVVLVDLPGHGSSPMPDPFTLQAGAAAIDAVLAAQKAESTIVVGQGMGALMAMLALEAHPERARGLVAIEMTLKKQFSVNDQMLDRFMAQIDLNYDKFLKSMFLGLGRDSAQGVAIHAQAAQVPAPIMKSYFREMMTFDPAEKAQTVRTPMLLIATDRLWAGKDSATVATSLGYEALQAPFTLRRLEKAGLMAPSEQPDSLAAWIGRFSRQLLAAKPK